MITHVAFFALKELKEEENNEILDLLKEHQEELKDDIIEWQWSKNENKNLHGYNYVFIGKYKGYDSLEKARSTKSHLKHLEFFKKHYKDLENKPTLVIDFTNK